MNCCGHKNEEKKQAHKHYSHIWMMVLCCGIPVMLILFLPYIGKLLPGASSILGPIIPFLCPILMLGMMFMMAIGGKKADKDDSGYHADTK